MIEINLQEKNTPSQNPANSARPANSVKGPNGVAIAAAVLMVPGIIITVIMIGFEISFISENPNFSSGFDMVVGLIATILVLVEVYYIFSVLMTKLGSLYYEPQKMKTTTILMLLINCLLFACCFVSMSLFEGWTSEGYFTLADMLFLTSAPGIAVKLIALAGQL